MVKPNIIKPRFPDRKISETFFDFASPILNPILELDDFEIVKEHAEKALEIASLVWNSVVLDVTNGDNKNVAEIRSTLASQPGPAFMVEQLIFRKYEKFANDNRLIGNYEFIQRKGQWRLRAESRDPTPQQK